MRFIGNKESLLDKIYLALEQKNVSGKTFFDFFSGTASVAKFFKRKGYSVISCDFLYLSYCLQRAYIVNNSEPKFAQIIPEIAKAEKVLLESPLDIVLAYLNKLEPVSGFIYNNYSVGGTKDLKIPRMYLSDANAQKIDAIRIQIEKWKSKNLLTDDEYYILLACLIESVGLFANISGVYAAFNKKWDPRALKPFIIKPIDLVFNKSKNMAFNVDSLTLLENINTDILYLDPPYNARQYAPNYHLLETIAKYDNPVIHGITGIRGYEHQKSSFCNKKTALQDLDRIASSAKYKYLILSYSSEGIMSEKDIKSVLSKYGNVEVVRLKYPRYNSHINKKNTKKQYVSELLYILKT